MPTAGSNPAWSSTFSSACVRTPTGRGRALRAHSVGVRLSPGTPAFAPRRFGSASPRIREGCRAEARRAKAGETPQAPLRIWRGGRAVDAVRGIRFPYGAPIRCEQARSLVRPKRPLRERETAGSNPVALTFRSWKMHSSWRAPLEWPAIGLENRGVREDRGSNPQLSAKFREAPIRPAGPALRCRRSPFAAGGSIPSASHQPSRQRRFGSATHLPSAKAAVP